MAGDFPSLADPQTTPKKSAAPTKKGTPAGGLFDQLMTTLNDIEDPFTRSIVQGAMEAKISDKIGQQFHFPDPGEQQLQATITERHLLDEQVKLKALKVQLAQAAMFDLTDMERAALRINPGEDPFQTDPQKAVEAANTLYENGRLTFKLSPSDLKTAEIEGQKVVANQAEAAAAAQAQTSKQLEQSASNIRAGETLAKAFAEAGQGKGIIGEPAMKAMEAATQTEDLDEDRGSEVFHNMLTNAVPDIAGATGQTEKFVASAMLSGDIGKRLKDELEGLDTNPETGALIVGKGDSGVTDTATTYLVATAMDLFSKAGVSDSEGMKMLGLDYTGIDLGSLTSAVTDLAKKRGLKEEVQARAFGQGFLESLAGMMAKERIGQAATKGK